MSAAPAFCLAWFRRAERDGTRPIDPVTQAWLEGLSQGRHARHFQQGAAGLLSNAALHVKGDDLVALRSDADDTALAMALADQDETSLAAATQPFVAMVLRRGGHALELFRDPLGQFPLFYQDNGQLLVACTSLDVLLTRPGWQRRLDRNAACHYLAFGTAGLGRTLEAGTRALPAAHALHVRSREGPYLRRYWSPLAVPGVKVLEGDDEHELRDELDASIRHAVTGRAAMLLSGGIDSGYMAHVLGDAQASNDIDAYTVRFITPGVKHECEAAARSAASAGIRHHSIAMSTADAVARLPEVLRGSQPRSAWSTLTHAHLFDAIRANGHRRLLSGLGADEVFGGYARYIRSYLRFRALLDAQDDEDYEACLDDVLARHDVAGNTLYTGVARFLDDEAMQQALGPQLAGWTHVGETIRFYREAREIRPRAHLFELMVAYECQHRVPDLLLSGFDVDAARLGMAVRYPFLASHIAGLACRLGATERFNLVGEVWKNKVALRRIAATRLPQEVFDRAAMTFGAPFVAWLGDRSFRQLIDATLEGDGAWPEGLLDRKWVDALVRHVAALDPHASPPAAAEQLWAVITLVAWYRKWIRNEEIG
ncbi:asparagine synthase-related protein [Dyella sp.]|uniref:asparagine synthase-related protein n=1 Tax=Dyella sp. TaxID=1869338 RepID=UPI002FDAB197